jgi:hypothetical protein
MKPMFFTDLSNVEIREGALHVRIPVTVKDMIINKLDVPEPEKYKFVFDIERKKKPRTTGFKSQQAHVHGHLSQIADFLGYYMSEIKEVMKDDLPDWPRKFIMGRTVYMSEADADTVLESKAIEWCHVKAAELGIMLKEE